MRPQSVILAAGEGTRLRPYTAAIPKCMVPLAGIPLLERQVRILQRFTDGPPIVVVGYRAEVLKAASDLEITIVENRRFAETNMVESLIAARSALSTSRDLIISYGDIVYGAQVLETALAASADVAIAVDTDWERLWRLRMEDPYTDAESMVIEEGRVIRLGDAHPRPQEVQGQYIGMVVVKAHALQKWWEFVNSIDPARRQSMYLTELLQSWIDAGNIVGAAQFAGGWLEVDTVQDLEAYEQRPALIEATEDV